MPREKQYEQALVYCVYIYDDLFWFNMPQSQGMGEVETGNRGLLDCCVRVFFSGYKASSGPRNAVRQPKRFVSGLVSHLSMMALLCNSFACWKKTPL